MFKLTEEIINNSIEIAHKILKEVYPKYKEPIIYSIKITNAHSYWANIGRCKEYPSGYGLHISRTFEQIKDIEVARNRFQSCMIHEMIHTQPGCNNHGYNFKRLCYYVNKKYPQYKVQTSTTDESVGITIESAPIKYIIKCKICGCESKYRRKPKYSLSKYICNRCNHSEFELINI